MNNYLLEEKKYNPQWNKTYEGMMAQGNGYMHLRASFEEGLADAPQNEIYLRTMKSVTTEVQHSPLSKCGTYLPLIMGKHPELGEVMVNLPFFMKFFVWADGEKIDMIQSRVQQYSRVLNMRNGLLTRTAIVETRKGCRLKFTWERFASMASKHLFAQKIRCEVLQGTAELEWRSGIDADVTTNGYRHFQKTAFMQEEEALICTVETDTEFKVMIKSLLLHAGEFPERTVEQKEKDISYHWKTKLNEGSDLSFYKFTVCGSSRDGDGNFTAALGQALKEAEKKGYETLLAENTSAWEALWDQAEIKIKGDEELQRGLNFSIYHLLRCGTEQSDRTQICAKGFAGEAYYGRYFWDSEIYLLPFYLYTNPKTARNLVMYRYHMLDGARKNAAQYHCRGARYPWQSGFTGEEQCSLWEYADNEIHITADVAHAVVHYFCATGDFAFLRDYGLEILLETARFWVDRIDHCANGESHLLNVMGPDEYSPMTKDNGFTNRLVQFNLDSAVRMADLVRESSPEGYAKLTKKIHFAEDELAGFRQAAGSLPIPFDPERDLFLQSADFEGYAALDIDSLWTDRRKPFGCFVSQEKIYRSKCLKQADTLAMMMLFPEEFTEHQVKTAYQYYEPITTHDSSLSPVVHAMVAHRVGMREDSEYFLKEAIKKDLCIEKRGAEDGIHIANCGCLWQMVVSGFCGITPATVSEALTVRPHLPKNITRLSFSLYWHGVPKKITVTQEGVKID